MKHKLNMMQSHSHSVVNAPILFPEGELEFEVIMQARDCIHHRCRDAMFFQQWEEQVMICCVTRFDEVNEESMGVLSMISSQLECTL